VTMECVERAGLCGFDQVPECRLLGQKARHLLGHEPYHPHVLLQGRLHMYERWSRQLSSGEFDQLGYLIEARGNRTETIGCRDRLPGDQRVECISGVVVQRVPIALGQRLLGEDPTFESY